MHSDRGKEEILFGGEKSKTHEKVEETGGSKS